MCVIDQAVARTFPQFVLPGGHGPLVATHTEKMIGNRTIRKKVRFVDGSTNKKVHCTRFLSLSDKLRPGLLGKVGNDAFLHTCTEQAPSRSLSMFAFPYHWRNCRRSALC